MTVKGCSDSNPDYWTRHTNLQRTKHALVRNYLQGWFAMYRSWAGRLVYMDTHAGREKHRGGQLGSPLLALRTLLRHKFRARILQRCEVVFNFIELDKRNLRYPRKQTNKLGRWIIEGTIAWLGNFRRLVVRWDRDVNIYRAFFHVACILITMRQF